jgi:DeoR/GlpR family transcriptional regulator of sugar metabolism
MSVSVGQAVAARIASPIADARLTNRLAMAYLLDAIAVFRGEEHLLDALLISAISQANVAPITRQADLQVAYAAPEAPPPDDMRRPVSINALATSLGLPFETVRRRVRGLLAREVCLSADGGVIVPTSVVTSPDYYRSTFAGYERLRALYYVLRDLELLKELPPPTVELDAGVTPLRTVARVANDYALRVIDTTMRAMGDLLTGLILMEVLRCNTEHLPRDERGGEGFGADDFVADELRRPVSITGVAARLGLPIETVRRHAAELFDRGLCVRVKGGLLVPSPALARPAMVAFSSENFVNLHRMFAGLSQLGVLAAWDRLPPVA